MMPIGNIEKVCSHRTASYTFVESIDNKHTHYNYLFLGLCIAAICFMLLVVGMSVVGAAITGTAPNPAGDTIIDDDTVWDGESNIYCGGDIRVGSSIKRVHFTISNSQVIVKDKWTMGGDTPVDFTLLDSTIAFDVQDGTPELASLGSGYINTNQMMVVEDTSDLSKPSRIELKDSTIRGTDYTYRAGGVLIKSGFNSAEHTLIVDNTTFSFMGGTTNTGHGYAALNTKYWDSSTLASNSRFTNLTLYYCGTGIKLVDQDGIVLNGATATRGYMAFQGGKSYTNLHMDKTKEGLYNPCDGALIRNSWFDSNNAKFNIMSASNVIFEYNYVTLAPFNVGDGSLSHQGLNNTIRHCTLDQTGIASRKDGTKIINNTFYRGAPYGSNMPIRVWGNNFLIEDNTINEGATAILVEPHPFYDRRGDHIIRGNTITNPGYGIFINKEDNVKLIDNTIDTTTAGYGILLKDSTDLLLHDNLITNTATYDIYFEGNNDNIKFINTKFDENKVSFADSSDIFNNYCYLDVKVVDASGNPIQGATVSITNDVDSNYPSINTNGEDKTSFVTGADGHISLPSDPENSIAIQDYWQTKTEKKDMRYTITAEKDGCSNSTTVNPDNSWYRENPNTYQNTVTIVLEGIRGSGTPPTLTAHSPTGSNVPMDADISVTFSEAMNKASAESAFAISPSVSGSFSWAGDKMTFTPGYDLAYGTTYIVTIGTEAKDLAGNDLASLYSWQFTTISDTTAPVLSNVAATGITGSSATIAWTTDEPATSQVESGLTTGYGSLTILDTNLVTTHSQTITELTPSTTHHYHVKSMDASDNLAISADYTFTTSKSEEDGLLGYWRFDDGSGTEAYDSSGNGNDGTIQGATWNTGKSGSALQFDGADDYVDAGPLWGSGDITEWSATFWIKLDELADGGLISKPGKWVPGSDFSFVYAKTYDRLYFGYGGTSGRGGWSTPFYPVEDNWYHIGLTFYMIDETNSMTTIYINGAIHDSKQTNWGPMEGTADHFIIGRCSQFGGSLSGIIDEIQIYNRALSAEEIMAHYEAGLDTTPPTLTAHSPTGSNVPMDADISVTFSEAMNKASAESAFAISPSVSGSFSWAGDKMTFTPGYDLAYGTTYIVTIGTEAKDLAGNDLASLYSWQFTTISDTTAPVLSNVAATGITGSSATIAWTTDEPATSQVESGLTTGYGSLTILDTNLVTTHSQTITELTPSTTHHYHVKSMDASDNLAISADYTFTTSKSEEDGLLGYWRFDDGSGTEAYDSSGNGNDGTIQGATWNTGKSGSALQFDGADDYVDAGPLWGSGDITEWSATFWIKLDELADGGLISKPGKWVPGSDFSFVYAKTYDRLYFGYGGTSGRGGWSTPFYPVEDNWYHIGLTFYMIDETNSMTTIYINGAIHDSKQTNWGPMEGTADHFMIGRCSQFGGSLSGIIDEIQIYNRALSAEEIMAHYETGLDTTPPTLTAHSPTGSNVPMDADISVTFSEAMNKASAESAFAISPSVSGSFNWNGNQMTFNPNSNLSYETTHTLTIGTGAEDLAGNILASPYNWQFTTKEAPTPPVLSDVAATDITDSSATITWTTDEASTSHLEYGLTTGYGSSTTQDTNLVTTHSQTITGLTASTTYHYRVKSMDVSDNLAISADYTFTTFKSEEDGLLGYWRFDDGSGTEAYDSSGSGNDGTINGATWTAGKSGSALQFDGADDYVDAGPLWGNGDITEWSATFWVKLDELADGGLISKPGKWVPGSDFSFVYAKTYDRLYFGYKGASGYGGWSTPFYPVEDEWYHIGLTFYMIDETHSDTVIYINGTVHNSVKTSWGPMKGTTDHLIIGRCSQFGGSLSGIIDEVLIYNRALSAEEIMAHYETGY